MLGSIPAAEVDARTKLGDRTVEMCGCGRSQRETGRKQRRKQERKVMVEGRALAAPPGNDMPNRASRLDH